VAPAGEYVLINNPLTTGDDVISNVLQNVPGATTANVWNGTGFSLFTYSAAQKHWKQGATVVDNTALPPGAGFFLNAPSAFTNTFVGSVVALTGGTATNVLSTSITPVGSLIPYADTVTNGSTINLQVGGGSTLQQWNIAAQKFNLFTYSAAQHTWKIGSTATNPVINVAEGFFIAPSSATNWVETLP